MDGVQFDAFAKRLASGITRRSALKVLGGGVAAIAASVLHRQVPEVAAGDVCGALLECCDNCQEFRVPGGVIRAFPQLQAVTCCDGLVCLPSELKGEDFSRCVECRVADASCASDGECCGELVCGTSETCESLPECSVEDGGCEGDGDCCDDLVCGGDNTCQPLPVCVADGDACEIDTDCCDGICCGGFCHDIECCIDDDDPNARCPEGTSCFEGVCDEITCNDAGGACETDQGCCGDLVCAESLCVVLSTCTAEGDSCSTSDECCGQTICIDSLCNTPRLPETGAGSRGESNLGEIAGAVAATAAALAAVKVARQGSHITNG